MRHLRAIVFDKRIKETWSMECLPLVQRIMNAQVREMLGVSPAEILYGNALNLHRGLLPTENGQVERTQPISRLSTYMHNLIETQRRLIEVAQEKQLAHDSFKMSHRHVNAFPADALCSCPRLRVTEQLLSTSGAVSSSATALTLRKTQCERSSHAVTAFPIFPVNQRRSRMSF
eukprot:scaffold3427_cov194-Ochromonas_danica.AAC.1